MPATPTDIAGGSRAAITAEWSSATILGRYPSAGDGRVAPREGFFDAVSDAQTVANAAGALLGVERRRFSVSIDGLTSFDPTTGTPTVQLVDSEQGASGMFLCARIELDLESERTSLELFG